MNSLAKIDKAPRYVLLLFGILCSTLGISILLSVASNVSWPQDLRTLGNDVQLPRVLCNTLILYLTAAVFQLLIAFVGTLYYVRRVHGAVKALLIAPYAAGVVAPAFSCYVLLSSGIGPFNFGILGTPLGAGLVVALIDTWQWAGVLLLVCFLQLEQVPSEHFEQARLEGISRRRRWQLIAWPRLMKVFSLYLIIRAIDWVRKVDVIKAMFGEGGPGNVAETLGIYATRTYYFSAGASYASLLALLQIVALGLAVWLALAFLERRFEFRQLTGEE